MEMDRTVAAIAICIALGFGALVGGITIGTMNANDGFYKAAAQCVEKGNSWVSQGYGICIAR